MRLRDALAKCTADGSTAVRLPAIRAWPLTSRLRWPRSVFGIGGAADRPECAAAVPSRCIAPLGLASAVPLRSALQTEHARPFAASTVRERGVAFLSMAQRATNGLAVACEDGSRAGYGVHACSDSDSSGRVLQQCSSERPEAIPWVNVGAAPANGVRGRRQGSGCQHAALVGRATETGSAEGACFVSIRRRVGPRGTRVGRCGWQPCAGRCLGKSWKRRQQDHRSPGLAPIA